MRNSLKIFSTSCLSLIILIRLMAMPFILAEYSINKNYIAKNLCENRAKPKMHCDGKCYLKKKLANAGENPDTQNQLPAPKISDVDFCESLPDLNLYLNGKLSDPLFALYTSLTPEGNTGNVFHPPIS